MNGTKNKKLNDPKISLNFFLRRKFPKRNCYLQNRTQLRFSPANKLKQILGSNSFFVAVSVQKLYFFLDLAFMFGSCLPPGVTGLNEQYNQTYLLNEYR